MLSYKSLKGRLQNGIVIYIKKDLLHAPLGDSRPSFPVPLSPDQDRPPAPCRTPGPPNYAPLFPPPAGPSGGPSPAGTPASPRPAGKGDTASSCGVSRAVYLPHCILPASVDRPHAVGEIDQAGCACERQTDLYCPGGRYAWQKAYHK